jgi:hypothetical protein
MHARNRFDFKISSLVAALALAASLNPALSAAGPAAEEAFAIAGPVAAPQKKASVVTPSARWFLGAVVVPELRLDPIDLEGLLREDAAAERQGGAITKKMRIGVLRELEVGAGQGDWFETAGGALWAMDVVSTGALGLRLHFAEVALPAGAELSVYAPRGDGGAEGEVLSYRSSSARADFVTPALFSERARIEYRRPAGADDQTLPFRLVDLRHVYRDPISGLPKAGLEKAAGNCHNDVSCFPEWGDLANAVALVDIGGLGSCTGTLLNDLAQDLTPYWLTANHCIDNGFDAANSDFYWFYQTASCGGAPPSLASRPRSSGASLISTNDASDYTLLQIEGTLPGGLFWSGWTSLAVANGTPEVAIHHPSGDFKRISFGDKADGGACGNFGGTSNFITTNWTDAPTEPGSSGSGIFRENTGQLIGTLTGGPSSCGNESYDCYGSFFQTYKKIKTPLKAGTDDRSDPNDSCAKARNVAKGTLSSRVVKVFDEDWYKINVPKGKTLTIQLDFAHGDGDVDAAMFASCGEEPFGVSDSVNDFEVLSAQNVSNKTAVLRWRVFLANDTRNTYSQTVRVE